jgi:hypothetical protein
MRTDNCERERLGVGASADSEFNYKIGMYVPGGVDPDESIAAAYRNLGFEPQVDGHLEVRVGRESRGVRISLCGVVACGESRVFDSLNEQMTNEGLK